MMNDSLFFLTKDLIATLAFSCLVYAMPLGSKLCRTEIGDSNHQHDIIITNIFILSVYFGFFIDIA